MKRLFILSPGERYGRLIVMSRASSVGRASMWQCVCDCGSVIQVRGYRLRSGGTKSCGCLRRETTGGTFRTHGRSESRTYRIWGHMLQRCTNPKHSKWSYYGGKGVAVCDRWFSFTNFLADMGEAPEGMSIDRINNDLGYEPGNCRWATQKEQVRNTGRNIVVTINGKSQCLSAWCEELNVPYDLAHNRVTKLGRQPLRALLTPKKEAMA